MSAEQACAFFVFAFVAAVTPGPSNVMLTAAGANAGIVRGLPALLGVCLGMASMMFAVAFGLGSLILGQPGVLAAMKWAGAALLLWLAWKIASAKGRRRAGRGATGRLRRCSGLSMGQPQGLARLRQRGRDLPAGGRGRRARAVARLRGAVRRRHAAQRLCLARLRRRLAPLAELARRLRAFNLAMGALLAASVILFVL